MSKVFTKLFRAHIWLSRTKVSFTPPSKLLKIACNLLKRKENFLTLLELAGRCVLSKYLRIKTLILKHFYLPEGSNNLRRVALQHRQVLKGPSTNPSMIVSATLLYIVKMMLATIQRQYCDVRTHPSSRLASF